VNIFQLITREAAATGTRIGNLRLALKARQAAILRQLAYMLQWHEASMTQTLLLLELWL